MLDPGRVAALRIVAGLSLGLIGKASGRTHWVEEKCRSEAVSISRLGGSRWRLRRTRCAMGFEWQSEIESRDGALAESRERPVGRVEEGEIKRIGNPQRRL